MKKPILCLDFDGVCHSYTSKWEGPEHIPDPPVDGLWAFLKGASEHFEIHIFSARSSYTKGIKAMIDWFLYYCDFTKVDKTLYGEDFITWVTSTNTHTLHFPPTKPAAFLSIDDRAMLFTGQWPDPQQLLDFKPWNDERKHQ